MKGDGVEYWNIYRLHILWLTLIRLRLSVILVSGRGLKNGENFDLLYKLADKLNAAGKY